MTSEKREAPDRPGEVQAYILQKEWEHRVEGDNYKIRFCPLPGCNNSKFNFEMHRSKGMYKCWSCGEHGGFKGLLTILGDTEFLDKVPTTKTVKVSQFSPKKEQPAPEGLDESAEDLHRKLFLRQPVLDYIHGRGFNDEALQHFKIGAKKQGGEYWLVIPHYADGKCVNLKFRNIEGKRQWGQTKGGKKILFNQDCLKSFEEVIFVEGELKAIALWQMGFPNVISLTGGVSTFDPSWIDVLEPIKKIYMLMDNDEAGKKCTEELSNRLGIDRIYHLELPDAKDADEYFFEKGHTAEEFSQLLRKAKRADVKNVINLATALERLETRLRDGGISNTGILTPWPAVNAITKGFRPGELVILSAAPKIGKCLSFGSLIVTPSGQRLTIEEMCRRKDPTVYSYNENTKKVGWETVSDWYDSGKQPCLKLLTRLGTFIETTHHHPYLTLNGWVEAKDLKEGDKIAMPRSMPIFGTRKWSDDECFIIGSLIADGGLTCTTVNWTKRDPVVRSKMIAAVSASYGLSYRLRDEITIVFTNGIQGGYENPLMRRCRELGIDCLSKLKRIPKEVFELDKSCLAKFIGALWSGDGSFPPLGLEYCSASEGLIDDLQHLLLRFGVILRKRKKNVKLGNKIFPSWFLSSGQRETILRFHSMIPIIGEKAETLNAMITSLNAEDKPARDYITSFPKEMWNEVKAACIRSGTTMTEMSRQYNGRAYTEAGRHIHSHTFKVNGGISRATLVRINAILNDEVLAAWIDSDVCFIEIDSIEDAGVQQCYDLTVPTTHSFIANDIVAHNTSLALNVTYELSLRGIPSLFYCMEMSSDRLAWKMACLANRREDIFVRADDVFYTSYLLRGKPFYLPELILTHDHNVIFETIRQAYRRYGLKLAVFDNLHFLCRDESHQREKLGVVSRGFKLLAEELQIPIILIVHPRKLKNSKQVMTSDDLKDSSSIHADADMVIVMHRDRLSTEDNPDDDDSTSEDDDNSIFSPETSIIVDAARYAPGGRAKLYFDGGQSRFLNMEDPDVPARN